MSVNGTQLQAVLAEEGLEHDAALVAALEQIASLRLTKVPAPSGELARLLAGAGAPTTAPLAVVRELPRTRAEARKAEAAAAAAARPRWVKRHRGAVIGVLVAAGMGLGATGVAAAMTGQGWDWQDLGRPAVGPTTSQADDSSAPGTSAVLPAGATDLSQHAVSGGTDGAASSGGQARRSGSQVKDSENQGTGGPQGQNSQGQNSQSTGRDRQSGDTSGPGKAASQSQGNPRPNATSSASPAASQGAGGADDGQSGNGQGAGR